MKFGDLKTGDVMTLAGQRAVVMAIENPHPVRPGFWMIVFYIFGQNRLSFDCLDPEYGLIPGTKITQDNLVSFQKALDEIAQYGG